MNEPQKMSAKRLEEARDAYRQERDYWRERSEPYDGPDIPRDDSGDGHEYGDD
jgi:hypothetical protein